MSLLRSFLPLVATFALVACLSSVEATVVDAADGAVEAHNGSDGEAESEAESAFDAGADSEVGSVDVVGDDGDAWEGEVQSCPLGQRILLGEVLNARDLACTPVGGGQVVAPDLIFRGAAPVAMSGAGCGEFAARGIKTVIDLRTDSERAASPQLPCVQQQAAIVVAPMPVPYNVSPDDYIADLDALASVAAAFSAFGDDGAYPIYFHCVHGRDRSGVLAAVVLLALGAASEDVMVEYELTAQAGYTTYSASLAAVLDEIQARGGVEAYLASAGVSSEAIAVLRKRAVQK
jgi:hypothetical protein